MSIVMVADMITSAQQLMESWCGRLGVGCRMWDVAQVDLQKKSDERDAKG